MNQNNDWNGNVSRWRGFFCLSHQLCAFKCHPANVQLCATSFIPWPHSLKALQHLARVYSSISSKLTLASPYMWLWPDALLRMTKADGTRGRERATKRLNLSATLSLQTPLSVNSETFRSKFTPHKLVDAAVCDWSEARGRDVIRYWSLQWRDSLCLCPSPSPLGSQDKLDSGDGTSCLCDPHMTWQGLLNMLLFWSDPLDWGRLLLLFAFAEGSLCPDVVGLKTLCVWSVPAWGKGMKAVSSSFLFWPSHPVSH